MIIDFHTHTFPDSIAERTIRYLSQKGGIHAYREGTVDSLKQSMKKAGIDISVVLPVATAAKQVESINRLSKELNGKDGIYFAGAIHPDCEDIDGVLDEVKAAGLFGIKLHPDYQGVYFDDDRYMRIMEGAAKRGLITVTHAGLDVGFPDEVHCTPDRVLNVLGALKGIIDDKLVLAHLGSYDAPDEVLDKIVGKPVYLDTAVMLDHHPDKSKQVIEAHGFDKVLFATDSPWADQSEYVKLLKQFDFGEENTKKLFYKNAAKLIKLDI